MLVRLALCSVPVVEEVQVQVILHELERARGLQGTRCTATRSPAGAAARCSSPPLFRSTKRPAPRSLRSWTSRASTAARPSRGATCGCTSVHARALLVVPLVPRTVSMAAALPPPQLPPRTLLRRRLGPRGPPLVRPRRGVRGAADAGRRSESRPTRARGRPWTAGAARLCRRAGAGGLCRRQCARLARKRGTTANVGTGATRAKTATAVAVATAATATTVAVVMVLVTVAVAGAATALAAASRRPSPGRRWQTGAGGSRVVRCAAVPSPRPASERTRESATRRAPVDRGTPSIRHHSALLRVGAHMRARMEVAPAGAATARWHRRHGDGSTVGSWHP